MAKVFVGFVATMAIVCHFGVQALDKATAKQCATHDWPQVAHQIHMDWCAANNYKTNWVTGVMPGGRTSHSVLPSAEMGTAQQENPVEFAIFLVASAIMLGLAKAGQR
jgi:hypothetical protein